MEGGCCATADDAEARRAVVAWVGAMVSGEASVPSAVTTVQATGRRQPADVGQDDATVARPEHTGSGVPLTGCPE